MLVRLPERSCRRELHARVQFPQVIFLFVLERGREARAYLQSSESRAQCEHADGSTLEVRVENTKPKGRGRYFRQHLCKLRVNR